MEDWVLHSQPIIHGFWPTILIVNNFEKQYKTECCDYLLGVATISTAIGWLYLFLVIGLRLCTTVIPVLSMERKCNYQ